MSFSAQKAKNLSMLNIGYQNSYPYDSILRTALYTKATKISVPTDMLTEQQRDELKKDKYNLTDNKMLSETEISWGKDD